MSRVRMEIGKDFVQSNLDDFYGKFILQPAIFRGYSFGFKGGNSFDIPRWGKTLRVWLKTFIF